jgi:alpha-amylase/alpha-mannosidase (GH57 family)
MHQPYYKDLLTQESESPWVRLHGTKDYLDMAQILRDYPAIHQTFNAVPSLIEQIEDYTQGAVKDRFLELSYKDASSLSEKEKEFLLDKFFNIYTRYCIAIHPRYYELYFKKQAKKEFTAQDYLDLQVWFNMAWTDPSFRNSIPELKALINKGRFFTEEEKRAALDKQLLILKEIIPAYKKMMEAGQLEVAVSPYYHPILPLLYNTNLAKEANPKTHLPAMQFKYPQDAKDQVDMAVAFYKDRFGKNPAGMWPSEESVCEHILNFFIEAGLNWIVSDEAILFKSLKLKKRDTGLLYRPHILQRKEGSLNIIFRDRHLSDLIGFVYHKWNAKDAAEDFLKQLENIHNVSKGRDALVTVAMDGENAWEYYPNDGRDFLNELYARLSEAKFLKTTTVSEYLKSFPAQNNIPRLAAGSWIYGDFGKWVGSPYKNKAWEYLGQARTELQKLIDAKQNINDLAWKQMRILEGSDWFWWAGEDLSGEFDKLFRKHLANFYTLLGKDTPEYLKIPLTDKVTH